MFVYEGLESPDFEPFFIDKLSLTSDFYRYMIIVIEATMIYRKKMTGLGSQEAELIATIGSSGLKVFSVNEAAMLLGFPNTTVSQIVHRLVEKQKLLRIEKAKYLIIPPAAWKTGEYTEEGIVIASQLIKPYYLSYWTALQFYGWTEQPSRTIFVATQRMKLPVELKGITIRFIRLKQSRFFGYSEHWIDTHKIAFADREKTIADCLDQPRYCGEIVEVAKGIWNGRKEIDFKSVIDSAVRMENISIIKRLGFLLDTLDLWPSRLRKEALKLVTPTTVLLDPNKNEAGFICADWHVRVNVNPKSLTDWRLT